MPSLLLPETLATLRAHKPMRPTFSNQIAAEMWDAKHTRGAFTVLRANDGRYIVHMRGKPNGQGHRGSFGTDREAMATVEMLAGSA